MSVSAFLLLLCAGSCYTHGDVVQVSVPPGIVSYTRPIEVLPQAVIEGRKYILVPEIKL